MTTSDFSRRLGGRFLRACVGLSLLIPFGCGGAEPPQGVAQQTAPESPSVTPMLSINELMVVWIDHSAHELWDREADGGAPKTDADWRGVERHATQLAASGTLIALGGTGQADPGWVRLPDWKRYSEELTKAGMAAREAAQSRNFDALVKANGQLVDVCERCHKEFKPDVPTEGKTHQPH